MSSSSTRLVVAPADLVHACVAYTRDEMQAFDTVIAEHSTGSLVSATPKTSLVDLPIELLLTVRHHLHSTLTRRTRSEAAAALTAYEDALLRGLCADCFWWNFDMHGPDVWEWVKNGYKEACQCSGGTGQAPAEKPEVSSRKGRSKLPSLSTVPPRGIATQRQWLDAFVERTYGAGGAWSELVPSVLASLSCEVGGVVASSSSPEELADYMRHPNASSEFGLAVVITPLRSGDDVALRRVTRELGLENATFKRVDAEERKRCTMLYAHQLLAHQPHAQQADYFQTHGHISCACPSCALLSASAPSASQHGAAASSRHADLLSFLSAVDVSIRHASTLISFAFISSLLCLTSMLLPRSSTNAKTEEA